MKFSCPQNALVVIADGGQATFYRNTGSSGIKLERTGSLDTNNDDGKGAVSLPTETSPKEKGEATVAKHLADELYKRVYNGGIDAVILIADPQTLGQIRPSLHKEVTQRITGELHKTLTNSSLADVEKILTNAAA